MRETGTQMPTQISPEAWECAMDIDTAVAELLGDHGLIRKTEQSQFITAVARRAQLSINKSLGKAGVPV
jgi:hypothetical protein